MQRTNIFLRSFVVAIPSPGTYFSWYHTTSFSPFLELSVQLSPCLLALPEHSGHENTSYYSLLYLALFSSYQLLLLDILYLHIIFHHHWIVNTFVFQHRIFVWRDWTGGSVVENLSGNAGEAGSNPGLRRSLGEGNGYPLQYSCLGNPMDRGALQATYSPGSLKSARSGLATKQYVLWTWLTLNIYSSTVWKYFSLQL